MLQCISQSQFFDKVNAANGANRYATMLTFLDDVEEGGETVFTNVPMPGANPDFSPCARDHLAVKPKKGEESCLCVHVLVYA